jgi:hypothetical protein
MNTNGFKKMNLVYDIHYPVNLNKFDFLRELSFN